MTDQKDDDAKSLSEWRAELKRNSVSYWLKFYYSLMGVSVSSSPRFYKALKLYGDWPMFEAIVAASGATLKGDPLNYVLKICSNKWKEMQEEADEETEYMQEIETIRDNSRQQNEEMASKLERIKNEKN